MGGGAVKVSVKGSMEIEKIQIADELMEKENKEDLEELLLACMNQALSKVKEEKEKNMKSMTGRNVHSGSVLNVPRKIRRSH